MASKPRNIFTRNKPLLNIYSGLDHEGKKVEVREDAEQLVKWHEIVDALVAAGYYRAQLQGLSAFDKIVGGLTWCIELCDIDVDVSLLFEENLTIGKKIALTEKIVKILPSMKCPHIIEPHQIQGLDFINIYPLVQWLIKYSSEFREAKEEELRKFAVKQYDKDHIFESDRLLFTQKAKFLQNLLAVQNIYKPCRVRKRKGAYPSNELELVNSTLSEYDQRTLIHISMQKDETKNNEELDFLYDYEKTLADPSQITTHMDSINIGKDSTVDDSEAKIHYAVLQSELTGELSKEIEESEKRKYSEEVKKLTQSIDTMEKESENYKALHESRMKDTKDQYSAVVSKLQKLTDKLIKSDDYTSKDVKQFYKSLKDLAKERTEMQQIIEHREGVLERNVEELRTLKDKKTTETEEPLTTSELKEFKERQDKLKEYIANVKLELGKLNREVLRYKMAADELPGAAELLQYEKRFVELYNQVASKHKETKQYYIFYNTLYEVKLYTSKELSLLNSILDNYEEAMSSPRKREEFMTQFESIVEWVNRAVKKVEQKHKEVKDKKSELHNEYSRLMDLQRQYAAALKKLAEERQKIGRKKS